jgi:hypothetical protein
VQFLERLQATVQARRPLLDKTAYGQSWSSGDLALEAMLIGP